MTSKQTRRGAARGSIPAEGDVSTAPARMTEPGDFAGVLQAYWPGGSGRLLLAEGTEVTLGRDPGCGLPIAHLSVSRRHAKLTLAGTLTVEDLASHNGTYVGSVRVGSRLGVPVADGQVITIGEALVIWQAHSASGVRAPPATRTRVTRPAVLLDPAVEHIYGLAKAAGSQPMTVLISGAPSTGRTCFARVVHQASRRSPLVVVECAGRPVASLETGLFGTERDGEPPTPGLIELAGSGTLLLLHVDELPESTQLKLLHALETATSSRARGSSQVPLRARIIATADLDLGAKVRQKRFSARLLSRLSGIHLRLPALRERPLEILAFAEHFLRAARVEAGKAVPTLSSAVEERLAALPWPGNLSELRSAMMAVALTDCGDRVEVAHLPAFVREAAIAPAVGALRAEIVATQRARVEAALQEASGNQTLAAVALGMSRRTLISWLDAWGAPRPRKRP